SEGSLLLCYVDHHDDAYRWAERRKLETHPKTGAAQLVEIREAVRKIPSQLELKQRPAGQVGLFANLTEEELLGYGVPADWIADVSAADEDSILDLADHLPQEASEALLEYATGGPKPAPAPLLALQT